MNFRGQDPPVDVASGRKDAAGTSYGRSLLSADRRASEAVPGKLSDQYAGLEFSACRVRLVPRQLGGEPKVREVASGPEAPRLLALGTQHPNILENQHNAVDAELLATKNWAPLTKIAPRLRSVDGIKYSARYRLVGSPISYNGEPADTGLRIVRHVVVFQPDAALERLMPAFDLALRVLRSSPDYPAGMRMDQLQRRPKSLVAASRESRLKSN